MDCIHSLYGKPEFAPYLVFAPECHYSNNDCVSHDMYTGRWWWETQVYSITTHFTGNLRHIDKTEEIGEIEERRYHSSCYHLLQQNADYNFPK